MKLANRYLAASLLSAFGTAANAQSEVRVTGTVDIAVLHAKADGQPARTTESTDGINNSGIGFAGTEDLGAGLTASFVLLMGANPNNGTVNAKFFNRRSTVSLTSSRWGEIRLGRDFVPTFWNLALADPFGVTGIANAGNVHQMYEGARADNSIAYFLPANLGGVFGQAMVSAAEGVANSGPLAPSVPPARYVGARLGWAGSGLTVAIAAGQRRYALATTVGSVGLAAFVPAMVAQPGDTQKIYNGYVAYKLPLATLMASFDRSQLRGARETVATLGAVVPIGVAEIHVGYDRSTLRNAAGAGSSNTVDQIKLGGVYNLSKRTALYTTTTRLDNKDRSTLTLSGNAGPTTPGGSSRAIEFGLRHFF